MGYYIETINENVLKLIKCSLWGGDISDIHLDSNTYKEMKSQTLIGLPTSILSGLHISPELYDAWEKDILQMIVYNKRCIYCQEHLPLTVPYVVLKGTTAAQYYPHPEYRAMGDIDIMIRREDFDFACGELKKAGYRIVKELKREVGYEKNGIIVELHRYFASLNNLEQAMYFDNLILSNIDETHRLPDLVNGLVLLEHISQHMENGLGLRQVVDWMMFVNQCLNDANWSEFCKIAERIGLTNLAITITKMCVMYLGLPARQWCEEAKEKTCQDLFSYIYSSGNFGNKQEHDTGRSIQAMYSVFSIKSLFALLQKHGVYNWKLAQRNRFFRKFAWMYQIGHYVKKGFLRDEAFIKIRSEFRMVQKRRELFDELGVKQLSKGVAMYENGKYKIKKHK